MEDPNPKQPVLCEECETNPSKYKCPGCSVRSCSLPCVKAHKQRTGCTGKRQQTKFVPISQFDDNLLISDYNMLEDVKRVAESAQRTRVKLCGYSHFRLPFPLKSLRSAAANRRTKLLFLSSGMSKRETNQSCYNNRKKFISWTIEWRFHSTDVVLIDHRVHENTNLCSVIENHLKPGPWNHRLRQFCEEPLESLKIFIRTYPKGSRSPYRELDIKAPLRQQLANIVILEYPVIHVLLPLHSYDFEVIKDAISQKPELESIGNNDPSPKGVTFREEEIADGSSLDPQVLDLMKHVKPNPEFQFPHQDKRTEKELNDTFDRPLLAKVAQVTKPVLKNDLCIHKSEDDNIYSSSKTEEPGFLEDLDFDFEQGLIDAYSNLIGQTNPDDFLDLEGMFTEEVELEERKDHSDFSGVFPVEEELEEGEIPGF
uniref:Box C/D snoRNA protein 1 n=1 Tax=Davidia involucrata TaxID=16924 RepID=A0A5B7BHN4_DAVIN